jgi:FKBP-type peptidyl-prolyl cis-trans isomerase
MTTAFYESSRFEHNLKRLNFTQIMKKSIVSILLILSVFASLAFTQTRRSTSGRGKRITVKKKIVIKKRTGRKTAMTTANSPAVTTATGLTYIITEHGTGAQLKAGDNVSINYTGLLTNGTKFDSSLDRGEPFSFPLGAGRVIKGWDEGVAKLRVGDKATLIIPSSLGYGSRGAGGVIPPDATLIFIVEVMGVK